MRRDEALVVVDDNNLIDSSGDWGWRRRRGSRAGCSSGNRRSDGSSGGSGESNGHWPTRKSSGRGRRSGSSGTLSKKLLRWRPEPVEVDPTPSQIPRAVGSDVQVSVSLFE